MPNTIPEVDRYIADAPDFAKPILERIRKAFHQASPEITESMKWRTPHFEYKGVLGSMAALRQHVAWGFWKAKLMSDPAGILEPAGRDTTSIGIGRISDVKGLPSEKVMVEYVKEAMRLNDQGAKFERAKPRPAGSRVDVPDYLQAALRKNAKARATFESFPSSHKREYVEWLEEAKQEATRTRRLAQAIEWMSEGKSRNWKYMKK